MNVYQHCFAIKVITKKISQQQFSAI